MQNQNIELIAELAQGYEGCLKQALLLVNAAAAGKADSVKFQLIFADEICTPDYEYYNLFKSLEMSFEDWKKIVDRANAFGMSLILDVFGLQSLEFAEKLKVDRLMVHATDLNNFGLLCKIADGKNRDVLLGVGGGYLQEIELAIQTLKNKNIILMAGFQAYPTPNSDIQISRIWYFYQTICLKYTNVILGYADHSLPDFPDLLGLATMAYGFGARVIEKHLTLGEAMKMEDYESAINPDKFLLFSQSIKSCVEAAGSVQKTDDFGMSDSEKSYRFKMRRNVVSARTLKTGEIIKNTDVVMKRSSKVSDFSDAKEIVGRRVKEDIAMNQTLSEELLTI